MISCAIKHPKPKTNLHETAAIYAGRLRMDHSYLFLWICTAYTRTCYLLLFKKQKADERTGECKAGEKYAAGEVDGEGELGGVLLIMKSRMTHT